MRARHRERGASLAETALVMGVVLLLLFGIIDFGRAMYTYSFVANAARMGARWMIVRGTQSCSGPIDNCGAGSAQVTTYVRTLNSGALNASKITAVANSGLNCPNGSSPGSAGCTAEVTVTYPFAFIVPYFTHFGTIVMTSTSQMVISQ